MNIGIVGYAIEQERYYNATRNCISSVYYSCNKIILILHRTSVEASERIKKEFPDIEVVSNPEWGNNLSMAWNYIMDRYFINSDYVAILNNDVVVVDGKFSWFNKDKYEPRGIICPVDRKLNPEYNFAAFIIFKWLYSSVGGFDPKIPIEGLDHDYEYRLNKVGISILPPGFGRGMSKEFIIDHHKSLTLNDIRYSPENGPGSDYYETNKKAEEYLKKKVGEC